MKLDLRIFFTEANEENQELFYNRCARGTPRNSRGREHRTRRALKRPRFQFPASSFKFHPSPSLSRLFALVDSVNGCENSLNLPPVKRGAEMKHSDFKINGTPCFRSSPVHRACFKAMSPHSNGFAVGFFALKACRLFLPISLCLGGLL